MQKMLDDIEKATEAYEKIKKDAALVKAGKPLQAADGKKQNVSLETCASRSPALLCLSVFAVALVVT
jgi:hypothetical protein